MKKIIIILSLLLLFLNFLCFPTYARELTSDSDSAQRKSTSKTPNKAGGETDPGGFGFDFGNVPDFTGNGWGNYGGRYGSGNPGGEYGGGYGSGYGGPSGGYSHHGVIRPSVVCTERGPCYKKRVSCPAKCFTSFSHSGKNGGGGGGGGGCTIDCKKHCVGYC